MANISWVFSSDDVLMSKLDPFPLSAKVGIGYGWKAWCMRLLGMNLAVLIFFSFYFTGKQQAAQPTGMPKKEKERKENMAFIAYLI